MMHLTRGHLGQALTAEADAQLRALDRVACQIYAGIRARTTPLCRLCRRATPTRPLAPGDIIPDTRRPGHAEPARADVPAATDAGSQKLVTLQEAERTKPMRRMTQDS